MGGNANAVKRASPRRLRRSTSSFNQWNPASRCALALPMNSSSRRCASCARPRSWSAIAFRATAKTQTASAPPLPTRLPAACRAGTSSKGSGCSVVLGRDLERPLQRGARLLEFCGGSVEIHGRQSKPGSMRLRPRPLTDALTRGSRQPAWGGWPASSRCA